MGSWPEAKLNMIFPANIYEDRGGKRSDTETEV